MNGRWLNTITACFALLVFSNMANAALVDRGGGLRYDTELDITWFPTRAYFDEVGFFSAERYADTATFYDPIRDITYSDWRLPRTMAPDPSCSPPRPGLGGPFSLFDCSGSEMGHLFQVHGIADVSNEGAFRSNLFYWSETEVPRTVEGDPSLDRYVFDFTTGEQYTAEITGDHLSAAAWLVSDGDIAAIPVPATAWLFGSGLVGLLATARRKRQS